MEKDGTKQVEFNKLKEKLIKEILSDFKDIERKYKEVKQLRDDTSYDLTTTLDKLKGSRQSATFTLKELHQLKELIEDQKRRLNELAIMAAKYGSSEQVDEEIQFWKKKLIEMDDRIAKTKIEIDVSYQVNENKRNELRNRDEYIKWLRLMIEMRWNIPEPVIVVAKPPPPPEPKTDYVAVSGDDVDELMAAKLREHNC